LNCAEAWSSGWSATTAPYSPDRALGIVLREPQIAEMPVKVFVNGEM